MAGASLSERQGGEASGYSRSDGSNVIRSMNNRERDRKSGSWKNFSARFCTVNRDAATVQTLKSFGNKGTFSKCRTSGSPAANVLTSTTSKRKVAGLADNFWR